MATELLMIRHAPSRDEGRLAGRRDVAAFIEDQDVSRLKAAIGTVDHVVASPMLRTRQTAGALFAAWDEVAALREQDFGAWEGVAYGELPDLGALSLAELAAHRPPEGESFNDLCARVCPALRALQGRVAVVAHAGTIRAALSIAVGEAALAFQVGNLSLTRLILLPEGQCSVVGVNWQP